MEEKKTIKFQMMLSESEARMIDDWMFANRLRSRAEAIRRLCMRSIVKDRNTVSQGEMKRLMESSDEQG